MGRPQQRQRQLVAYADILAETVGQPPPLPTSGGCRDRKGRLCTLCWGRCLTYPTEVKLKTQALARWAAQVPSLPPPRWLGSPTGRHYRTVSKRRWLHENRQLIMVEGIERGRLKGIAPGACQIEPVSHAALYHALQTELSHSSLSRHLNYAIVKSGSQWDVLVLNLNDMRGQRAELNRISKKLTHHFETLKAIWLVQGQEGDEYYANIRPGQWQKLYGENHLTDALGLHYSPLCFSQVNGGCLPLLLETAKGWLGDPSWPMLDLYCGYGLFSLGLTRSGPTWGLDLSGEAVLWARRNAKRLGREKARFEPWDLANMEIPERRFPTGNWVAVLDPPRSGAPDALIASLGQMRPRKVMHWICSSDELDGQLRAWIEAGYRVTEAVAVDMFCGTSSLELGLCLEPGGRLRSAKPSHLTSKAGTPSQCKPPKKPARSPVTSTENGARPKRPKP